MIVHGVYLVDAIPLGDIARELAVSTQTIRRWADSGLRGHVLKTIRVGYGIRTTRAWTEQFIAATNSDHEPATAAVTKPVRDARREKAARELDRLGI